MMAEEKDMEELFSGFRPEMAGRDVFMASLERRLDTVEMVRRMRDARIRRYRRLVVAAFMAGLACGCALSALLAAFPGMMQAFPSWLMQALPLVFTEANGRMVALTVPALLLGGGVVAVIGMCRNLRECSRAALR